MATPRLARRALLLASPAALLAATTLPAIAGTVAAATPIEVWRSPSCGCCHGWVAHLQAEGFAVSDHLVEDLAPVRRMAGVPEELASCHTGIVAGYAVEGHVPADAIRRMLAERPSIKGLAVPGMPASAPGMAEPGAPFEPYDVIAFGPDGRRAVFRSYTA